MSRNRRGDRSRRSAWTQDNRGARRAGMGDRRHRSRRRARRPCGRGAGGVDIPDADAMQEAVQRIDAKFGRPDGLVNIAGGFAWETVADGSIATWEKLFAVNLLAALTASRASLPLLRAARGAIVNIGAAACAVTGALVPVMGRV